jgi:hypothetical protein
MVLVVMYLYFNVFMFIQSRNVAFQDTISQSQQLDVDRNTEQVTISNVTCTPTSISCNITNTGPLPVQIVRLWVVDSHASVQNYAQLPVHIILQPGANVPFDKTVTINGASINDRLTIWFVTARGNLVKAP